MKPVSKFQEWNAQCVLIGKDEMDAFAEKLCYDLSGIVCRKASYEISSSRFTISRTIENEYGSTLGLSVCSFPMLPYKCGRDERLYVMFGIPTKCCLSKMRSKYDAEIWDDDSSNLLMDICDQVRIYCQPEVKGE